MSVEDMERQWYEDKPIRSAVYALLSPEPGATPVRMTRDEIAGAVGYPLADVRRVLSVEEVRGVLARKAIDGRLVGDAPGGYVWVPVEKRKARHADQARGTSPNVETEILSFLGDASEPVELAELGAAVGIRGDNLRVRYLSKLIDRGLVVQVSAGGGRGNPATFALTPDEAETVAN